MASKPKLSQQGSLLPVDIEAVWSEFIETSGWRDIDKAVQRIAMVEEVQSYTRQEAAINQRMAKLNEELAVVKAKREAVEQREKTLESREDLARQHLESAAKKMGAYATKAVLLASLREAFPPVKVKAGRVGVPGQSGNPETGSLSQVLDVLDSEGLSCIDIVNAMRERGQAITSKQVADYMAVAIKKGLVATDGQRRSKTYRRVEQPEAGEQGGAG